MWSQSLVPAKYSGRLEFLGRGGKPRNETITLTIQNVTGNKFEGVAWVGTEHCRIDVPVRGSIEGDALKVRAIEKEPCNVNWDLKVVGERLEGTSGRVRWSY